jgi:hypothetical protein
LLSQPQGPQGPQSSGSFWLLAAAILFYIPWLLAFRAAPSWVEPGSGSSGEERISEAWATLIVLVLSIPLWLALGGMVLLAWRKGFAPRAWAAASGVLYAIAAIATLVAARTYFTWPGGWSIVVPALLPPLLALYGIWVRAPWLVAGSMHLGPIHSGPMRLVPMIALGAVALVAFAAIPFAFIDPLGYPARLAQHSKLLDMAFARRDAEAEDTALRWEAGIHELGPGSSLASWLDYVNGSTEPGPLHQEAMNGARHANNRQADAVELLDNGQIRKLAVLWQLDVVATPALCAAYDRALYRLATTDEPFEAVVGEQLEQQLSNIDFLLAAHCDLSAGLGAAKTRAGKVADVNPGEEKWIKFHAALSNLRRSP